MAGHLSDKLTKAFGEEKAKFMVTNDTGHLQKDFEYDWTERLKNWRAVQISKGTINNFKDANTKSNKSVSIEVLSCLQADYNSETLSHEIENFLVLGLRRAAGLNLLDFGMGMNGMNE